MKPRIKTVKLSVRKQDIERGRRVHCTKCPVARALFRVLSNHYKSLRKVEVGSNHAWIRLSSKTYRVELPQEACNFIVCFDTRAKTGIKPFKCDIDLSLGNRVYSY